MNTATATFEDVELILAEVRTRTGVEDEFLLQMKHPAQRLIVSGAFTIIRGSTVSTITSTGRIEFRLYFNDAPSNTRAHTHKLRRKICLLPGKFYVHHGKQPKFVEKS